MEANETHHEPLAYLTQRFEADAETLRLRAKSAPTPKGQARGPDAEASRRMAEACTDVLARLRAIDSQVRSAATSPNGVSGGNGANGAAGDSPVEPSASGELDATLLALEKLARSLAGAAERHTDPWVRSVYGGAATRVTDVVARTRAAWELEDDDA